VFDFFTEISPNGGTRIGFLRSLDKGQSFRGPRYATTIATIFGSITPDTQEPVRDAAILFDVTFDWSGWLCVLPALIVSGLMLGALWLFLSVYIRQVENFAGTMNFVMFPMFFFSSALYPLWRLREGGSELLYLVALANPFTHAVEMIRFALYGMLEPVATAVVTCATMLFFLLAVAGYDPQRGMFRRTVQPV